MRLKSLNDQELLALYIQGSENALAELLHRHKRKIFSYIVSRVLDREVANDIFQETFYRVIKTIKSENYREDGKFISWVMRIAHNLIIDHFRDCKKIPRNSGNENWNIFDSLNLLEENVQDRIVKSQIELDLRKMIEQLPDDQKEMVKMRLYGELSFKEISEIKNISINTSLGRFRYAVLNLRKMMNVNKIILEA
jgi:RNA polymerase sigma-70 factor (ECF subfamily)